MDVNVSNICFAPTSKPEVLLSHYRYQIGRQTKLLLNRKNICWYIVAETFLRDVHPKLLSNMI